MKEVKALKTDKSRQPLGAQASPAQLTIPLPDAGVASALAAPPVSDDMEPEREHEQEPEQEHDHRIHEPRLWRDDGWTARVIKNEDDDGWAVEMTQDGQAEPALVGPWTMGRDKKNPKPLDSAAFRTLVKTANEVLRRHEQQLHASLHKSVKIDATAGRLTVKLDIVPDEYEPYAVLSAYDELGEQLAQVQVPPTYKLNVQSATQWVAGGFRKPG